VSEIADLGRQPLANKFLKVTEFSEEYFYQLSILFCAECKLLQLREQPEPDLMFHDEYKFFSHTSKSMAEHFKSTAHSLYQEFLAPLKVNSVLEIGCNDGIFLKNLLGKVTNVVGIDPSQNVTRNAKELGIDVLDSFFTKEASDEVLSKYGPINLIYAANVICHIPKLNEFFKVLTETLDENGVFVFEEPYLGNLFENNSYDQIYDEHVFIFSVSAIDTICRKMNLTLFRCENLWTHGGSMRYFISKNKNIQVDKSINLAIELETKLGLNETDALKSKALQFKAQATKLNEMLTEIAASGKKIVGYGATSKSATILNFANIGPEIIDYITDNTPAKVGLFSPGKHIPIKSYEEYTSEEQDFVVLFAWNHAKEIFSKESSDPRNIQWIMPFPIPRFVSKNDFT
jgi:methylation protein EvaC